MKKILLSLLVLASVSHAGLWTSAMSVGDQKIKPNAFQLDTHGWNVRGYEFTPPSSNNTTCVVLFSESQYKSPVMQCFKKDK